MTGPGAGARVVSLVPSVTETLIAWGIQPVGVTRFCEQPGLRAVGGTKNPDVAAIVDLAPDLVVVDREENRSEDAAALAASGVDVHVMHVTDVAFLSSQLAALAERLDVDDARLPQLAQSSTTASVSAFVPIWRGPWMSINGATYGSSLLAAAGIANVLAAEAERYPTVTLPEVAARRPDLVLAPSEPYPFRERHRAELEQVGPVVLVDGRDLFWWGVRTPGALDRFTALADSARATRRSGP